MSKKKAPVKKKKVVSVSSGSTSQKTLKPTVSRTKVSKSQKQQPLLFGRTNYMYMIGGVILMALGFVAMSGGGMDDPNVWDESIIYGWRRTVLAPILLIAGLVAQIFAIFKKA
ncbi:MAG: DUF3098 domain-containing protein [Bacteroidia bacterium]|nr:DUF3098 domain-containing protein [Bacteroidia bacterium]